VSVTLAILAGGRGERLGGVAQGLLRRDGQTLLERLLALCTLADEVLLVADEPAAYARFGVRCVKDAVAGKGAPGGVHAALSAARTRWVLAVACDMPFVSEQAVAPLLEERARGEVVVFGEGERLEPFPGLYATRLAAEWGAALAENPSLRSLCRRFSPAIVPIERLRAVDPQARALASVNTPEELRLFGIEGPSREDGGSSA
jgi:molybdopterin-guanine dinucleotide biosynthesis protein A